VITFQEVAAVDCEGIMKTSGPKETRDYTVKNAKKPLHALQMTASTTGGKENQLVGGRRLLATQCHVQQPEEAMKVLPRELVVERSDGPPTKKAASPKKIIASDLTSEEDGPSERYWQVLAERRKMALEETLKENQSLHERIELLKEENATLKSLVAESTEVIEVLNLIIDEAKAEGKFLDDELESTNECEEGATVVKEKEEEVKEAVAKNK